jgi:predicted ArsR family transcriptional regulator
MDRKTRVLALLKARGSATLAELAAHLGLSKQGTLRHLEALESRGMVEVSTDAHHGPGRPVHVYRLAAAASEVFPSAHRQLAGQLVEFMDSGELERFFASRAERMEAEYGSQMAGLDFDGRVRELARLASEDGHMTELIEREDGTFQVRHCNCPIGDVAARTSHPCEHELDMYQSLLGGAVVRSTWAGAGDATCTYDIPNTTTRMKKIG